MATPSMVLNQITLPCTNYDASVAFYRQLGLVQIVDAGPRYARFESQDGNGATLSLHDVKETPTHGSVIYFDHESASELDAHVDALLEQGMVFDSLPTDQIWGWREARLQDPAGNTVCLMFAGDNRRFPRWRVEG